MRSDFINRVKMSDYKGSDKAGPAGLKGVAEGEEDPYLRKELGKLELR
jgi:hypothetical protein